MYLIWKGGSGWKFVVVYVNSRADHTGQFRRHSLASPAVIVRKVVGHHLFLNIIPNNFTARTERKIWCDRGIIHRGCREFNRHHIYID